MTSIPPHQNTVARTQRAAAAAAAAAAEIRAKSRINFYYGKKRGRTRSSGRFLFRRARSATIATPLACAPFRRSL